MTPMAREDHYPDGHIRSSDFTDSPQAPAGRLVDKETGEIREPEGREWARKDIEALLETAYGYKLDRVTAERAYARLMGTSAKPGPIRAYAERHPEEEIRDAEHGLTLAHKTSHSLRLDTMGLVVENIGALMRLAELGLLQLDVTAWKAHKKDFPEAQTVRRFLLEGETTSYEIVKED